MRHQSRETAFKIIYQIDMGKNDLETALRCTMENDGLTQQEQAFCQELVRAVEEHLIEIDEIIQRNTVGWHVERMMSVDRNLLRMAVYEMLYSAHISPKGALMKCWSWPRFTENRSRRHLLTVFWIRS